jgi:hypothetical protein
MDSYLHMAVCAKADVKERGCINRAAETNGHGILSVQPGARDRVDAPTVGFIVGETVGSGIAVE